MFENDGMFGNPDVQEDFAIYQTDMDTCMVCAETTLINQFLPDLNLDQYQAAYISPRLL